MAAENIETRTDSVKPLKKICLEYVGKNFSLFRPSLHKVTRSLIPSLKLEKKIHNLSKAKTNKLVEIAHKNLDIALLILKTPKLLDKLGRYDQKTIFQLTESVSTSCSKHFDNIDNINGTHLFTICNAHPETRKLALEVEEIKSRLASSHIDQLRPPSRIQPSCLYL
jgi:hypothetical protein